MQVTDLFHEFVFTFWHTAFARLHVPTAPLSRWRRRRGRAGELRRRRAATSLFFLFLPVPHLVNGACRIWCSSIAAARSVPGDNAGLLCASPLGHDHENHDDHHRDLDQRLQLQGVRPEAHELPDVSRRLVSAEHGDDHGRRLRTRHCSAATPYKSVEEQLEHCKAKHHEEGAV